MAAPLTCISSMATRGVLRELAASYQSLCGQAVEIESVGGVNAARRVTAGEAFDVVVLASNVLIRLEAEGFILGASSVDFARSSMAIAVGAYAPRPSIEDEDAVRRAILNARSIGYSTGPSGDHLKNLWMRWGLREEISRKAVQASPGVSVASLIASGKVDIGFQQMSELIHQPGVLVLGSMPADLQATTIFAAGVGAVARRPEIARAFVEHLALPEATAVKHRCGLDSA